MRRCAARLRWSPPRCALGSPSTTTSVTASGGSPSSQGRQFTVGELGQPATATLVLSEVTAHYL
jgi:hypothetical protein